MLQQVTECTARERSTILSAVWKYQKLTGSDHFERKAMEHELSGARAWRTSDDCKSTSLRLMDDKPFDTWCHSHNRHLCTPTQYQMACVSRDPTVGSLKITSWGLWAVLNNLVDYLPTSRISLKINKLCRRRKRKSAKKKKAQDKRRGGKETTSKGLVN